jgi:hypothetical protein
MIRAKTKLETKEEIERASCPACIAQRPHSEEEWKNHPNRGQGCTDGMWTSSELEQDLVERTEKERQARLEPHGIRRAGNPAA